MVKTEELLKKLTPGNRITFTKTVNVYDVISHIKANKHNIKHKYYDAFLDKIVNESCVIVLIKTFYQGALREDDGEWIAVDFKIDHEDMSKVNINFEFTKLYNRSIDSFVTEEERNKYISGESNEVRILINKIIFELTEQMPFLEMIDYIFSEFVNAKFLAIVESNLSKEERKLKISIEELDSLLLTEIFREHSVVIKENMYMRNESNT